jgi:hypothetical protein
MKSKYLLLVVTLLLGFLSCNNVETKEGNIEEETIVSQTSEDAVVAVEKAKKVNKITDLYHLSDIKIGDILGGLHVNFLSYQPDTAFSIKFDGELVLKGMIQENPLEYTTDFYPEESPVTIEISDNEYKLFESLQIINSDDLKATMTAEQKSQFKEGILVPAELKLKDPAYVLNFGDKGRLGYGEAEWVKE